MTTVQWLLQAGFLITTPGARVAVDPYLSDACQTIYGLTRSSPPPLMVDDLAADVVCVSHWHEDHLDLPTILRAAGRGAVIVAPDSCLDRIRGHQRGAGGPSDEQRLVPAIAGQAIDLGGARVTPVPAVHRVPGFLTEDAVGFVIEVGGVRIYHSGDTEYHRSLINEHTRELDLALICSNGTGGNLNVLEAAMLTAQLRPRVAVPMHFGLWDDAGYGAGATLDPLGYQQVLAAIAADVEVWIPSVDGEFSVDGPLGETSRQVGFGS